MFKTSRAADFANKIDRFFINERGENLYTGGQHTADQEKIMTAVTDKVEAYLLPKWDKHSSKPNSERRLDATCKDATHLIGKLKHPAAWPMTMSATQKVLQKLSHDAAHGNAHFTSVDPKTGRYFSAVTNQPPAQNVNFEQLQRENSSLSSYLQPQSGVAGTPVYENGPGTNVA